MPLVRLLVTDLVLVLVGQFHDFVVEATATGLNSETTVQKLQLLLELHCDGNGNGNSTVDLWELWLLLR